MLTEDFLSPRILIVAGKGGVGKTTVSAALALIAARSARRVCIAEVDRKGALSKLFGKSHLDYEPSELAPGVWGVNIVIEDALAEYLEVQYHIKKISRVLMSAHFIDYITTAAPGLKDILALGKIWYLEQGRSTSGSKLAFDTIIVDAEATGHMLTFLSAPMSLSDTVQRGPVRKQSDWLRDMLRNPNRTRVHLVTLPEEMPVMETLETSKALEQRLGIASGVVFANAVYPRSGLEGDWNETDFGARERTDLKSKAKAVGLVLEDEDLDGLFDYARFRKARREVQDQHLSALRKGVSEPVVELPFLFSAGLSLPEIEQLADVIEDRIGVL